MNGSVTIVATQSLQLGAVSVSSLIRLTVIFYLSLLSLLQLLSFLLCSLFDFCLKSGRFDVSRKCDVTN